MIACPVKCEMKSFIHSQTSNFNICTVRWSLGMDRSFQLTHYNGCNYLSMLDLKLYHVSKIVCNDEGKSTQMKQFIHSQCHFVMILYFWILQKSHRCCEAITYFNIIVDFLLETLVTAPDGEMCKNVTPGNNSLRPSDAIWRQGSGLTLAHVMASCLTAPSHYMNQYWLIISEVQWHSY